MYAQKFYSVEELYGTQNAANKCGIIEYIDCSESENALIALSPDDFMMHPEMRYTHCEIHESLMLGVMCNQIPFAEHSDANRSTFSCAQSKQACSMFHTNYQSRMDKSAIVLNYGTMPIVKTRYSEYIDRGEHPYGENVTVAIMCYTGYNVEDAVLLNRAAVDRGMFRTTHYSMYEVVEMSEKVDVMENMETVIANPLIHSRIESVKSGVDYSLLDESGLIREGVAVTDKTVLIGAVAQGTSATAGATDKSVLPKKGQLGKVDRIFMTSGAPGKRVAKVRVLEQRRPAMGDKMASRLGQKGVVGLVIEEADMPFTREGLRPDMIINPHAFPTRKTISQLIESLLGKTCVFHGAHGDGTTFATKGDKVAAFGTALQRYGYHSAGEEVLYNGMTGTQIKSDIFVGPTYYMRLKHMVKDKINYRARGARSVLTKQTTGGRANDGGLRIGEMERDVIVSHGMSGFLRDSMMSRGDSYDLAICNKSGMIAVYNSAKNIFMSPIVDGPIQFKGSTDTGEFNVRTITKFGRSFSIVRVPYVFKLLIQELQTTNIQLRLITADNIDVIADLTSTRSLSLPSPDIVSNLSSNELYQDISAPSEEEEFGYKEDEAEDEDNSYENMPTLEFTSSGMEDGEPAIEFETLDGTAPDNNALSLSNPDKMDVLPEPEMDASSVPTSPTFSFSPTIHITTAESPGSPNKVPSNKTSPAPTSPSSAATDDTDIFKMGPVTVTKMDS
jgi:DNA-directed RNA polymerase beta subunit